MFNSFHVTLEKDREPTAAAAGVVAATTRAASQGAVEAGVSEGVQGVVARAMLRPGRDKDLVETLVDRRRSTGATAVNATASRLHSFTAPITPAQQQQALVGAEEPMSVLLQVDLYLPADQDVLDELQRRFGVERKEWAARQTSSVTAASAASVPLPDEELVAAQAAVAEAVDAAELAATAAQEAAALVAAAASRKASAAATAAAGVTRSVVGRQQMGYTGDWQRWRECEGTLAFFRNGLSSRGAECADSWGRS
jgi:hypothetical protein